MTRLTSPLLPLTTAAGALGLLASTLIAFTPVVHAGIPLAMVTGGMMLMLAAAGLVLDRRRALPAPVVAHAVAAESARGHQ